MTQKPSERSKDAKHESKLAMSPGEQQIKLLIAIEAEELDTVFSLLEAKAPVSDAQLLVKATENRHFGIFNLLCEAKATHALPAETPLAEEVAFAPWPLGERRAVLNLLKQWESLPPILEAALLGKQKELEAEAKLSRAEIVNDSQQRSALHYACAGGDLSMVEFLLANPLIFYPESVLTDGESLKPPVLHFEIFARDKRSRTPLHISAAHGHLELTKLFLKFCKINRLDDNGHTACHLAAQHGHLNILELFIRNNFSFKTYPEISLDASATTMKYLRENTFCDLNGQNARGLTPLHIAAKKGRKAEVEFLLKQGVSITIKSNESLTALDYAVIAGHVKIVEILLERYKKDKGWQVAAFATKYLLGAAHKGHVDMVNLLLRLRASTGEKTSESRQTALHLAAAAGHTATVRLLLDNKAAINEQDWRSQTPLHLAVIKDQAAAARLLLDNKASLSVINHNGSMALHDARSEEMISLLLAAGASVNALTTTFNSTPLLCLLYGSKTSLEMIRLLIHSGADISATDMMGEDVLTAACKALDPDPPGATRLQKIRLLLELKAVLKPRHLKLPEIQQALEQAARRRALGFLAGFHPRNARENKSQVLLTAQCHPRWPHNHGLTYLILQASVKLPGSKPIQSTSSASSLPPSAPVPSSVIAEPAQISSSTAEPSASALSSAAVAPASGDPELPEAGSISFSYNRVGV